MPRLVDAVEIRIALEDVAVGRRLRLQHPGLQRRIVEVVVPVGAVLAVEQRHPILLARPPRPSSSPPPGRRIWRGTASGNATGRKISTGCAAASAGRKNELGFDQV